MAKFLFTILPAVGHINPTLPIAVELKKRGHQVAYALGPDLRPGIEAEGLQFFPAGPESLKSYISPLSQKMLDHTGLRSNFYFFKVLIELNTKTLPEMRAVVETFRPDVIVADSLSHAGAQTAEVLGIPWATYCSVPGLIPTSDAPPFTSWGLPPSENPLVLAAYGVIRLGQNLFIRLFDREFNAIRASLGLGPLPRCAIESCLSSGLILVCSCEGFEYKRSDWPRQAHLIGPAPWGKSGNASQAVSWIDDLPGDKPVVYATLGTVQAYRSIQFFNIIIEALKDADCRVILSVGHAVDLSAFRDVPSHFRIERFVPHAYMLPRCTAVIHHGGLGVAQDCIYNGVPSVVVPISQDLYEVARRCSTAGVSLTIPYPRITPGRLRTAVQKVLTTPALKENTLRLREAFRKTAAAANGADLLEAFARTKKPVYRPET